MKWTREQIEDMVASLDEAGKQFLFETLTATDELGDFVHPDFVARLYCEPEFLTLGCANSQN
jgi:hypothetical protein